MRDIPKTEYTRHNTLKKIMNLFVIQKWENCPKFKRIFKKDRLDFGLRRPWFHDKDRDDRMQFCDPEKKSWNQLLNVY